MVQQHGTVLIEVESKMSKLCQVCRFCLGLEVIWHGSCRVSVVKRIGDDVMEYVILVVVV